MEVVLRKYGSCIQFRASMILSRKHNFIFIKTKKTGSTSIEVFLSSLCGFEDTFTEIFPHVERHQARNYEEGGFKRHMPARAIRKKVSDNVWNHYYKFCVERNPWDKTLSHYHMLNYRSNNTLSLDQYFSRESFCHNRPKYVDDDGSLLVDKVIKYEELITDLSKTFDLLGIPFDGDLGVRAKSEYRTDRRHYRDVLTPAQAEKIGQIFEAEITMHGYQF